MNIKTKFADELKTVKLTKKGGAVSKSVVDVLADFCGQSDEFAQAVIQSDKKVGECIESTVKDCGNSISDIDVYRKAVQFYFPGADIHFNMVIDLGDGGFSTQQPTEKSTGMQMSLDSLLDF